MAPIESVSGNGHSSGTISGKIHGGNQPVSGATVTLYRASQQTFASGATALAHTTSATDGYGSFAFAKDAAAANDNSGNTYSCSGSGVHNPFLFLVARGGTTVNTPGAAANPDAAFIAPLGRCDSVDANTFVNMSEVVTVATMAAMHQFMNPSVSGGIETSVGADGIFVSDLALGNASYSVSNMVDLSTGLGNSSLLKAGAAVNVTVTPELAKINQLANAVSSCINFSGAGNPNCSALYGSAAPPSDTSTTSVGGAAMPVATDLLTALYYIFTNPTNATATGGDGTANRSTIFNLSGVSGVPYQPTMIAAPTDWTIGVSFTSTSNCSDVAGSTAGYLNNPSSLSLDQYGNVFFSNNQAGAGSLGSLNGTGTPASCTTLVATSGTPNGSMATVVDSTDHVYAGLINTTDVYSYNPNVPTAAAVHFSTPAPVLGLAADGVGDVFFSTADGKLYLTTPSASSTSGSLISTTLDNTGGATSLIVDAQGRIWASGASTSTGNKGTVTYPDSTSSTGYTTVGTGSSLLGPQAALTVGKDAGATTLYSTDGAALEYAVYPNPASGSAPVPSTTGSHVGGGLLVPVALAVDGAQNVWVANSTGSISGFSAAGTPLAPAGYVKDLSYFSAAKAISVDASGNIWVASGPNTITEVVGAAVPVMKSYATALATNRFQQIP